MHFQIMMEEIRTIMEEIRTIMVEEETIMGEEETVEVVETVGVEEVIVVEIEFTINIYQ